MNQVNPTINNNIINNKFHIKSYKKLKSLYFPILFQWITIILIIVYNYYIIYHRILIYIKLKE